MSGRTRLIRPGICDNEELGCCSLAAQLTADRLAIWVDRKGMIEDRPKRIHKQVAAFTEMDMDAALDELAAVGFISRRPGVNAEGEPCRIVTILKFEKHQRPHRNEPCYGLVYDDTAEYKDTPMTPERNIPKNSDLAESHDKSRQVATKCDSSLALSSSFSSKIELGYQESTNVTPSVDAPAGNGGKPPKPDEESLEDRFARYLTEQTPETIEARLKPPKPPSHPFEPFWDTYPRHTGRARAEKAWRRLTAAQRKAATEALPSHIEHWANTKRPVDKVPHASTWLNGKCWDDSLPTGYVAGAAQSLEDEVAEIDALIEQRRRSEVAK